MLDGLKKRLAEMEAVQDRHDLILVFPSGMGVGEGDRPCPIPEAVQAWGCSRIVRDGHGNRARIDTRSNAAAREAAKIRRIMKGFYDEQS